MRTSRKLAVTGPAGSLPWRACYCGPRTSHHGMDLRLILSPMSPFQNRRCQPCLRSRSCDTRGHQLRARFRRFACSRSRSGGFGPCAGSLTGQLKEFHIYQKTTPSFQPCELSFNTPKGLAASRSPNVRVFRRKKIPERTHGRTNCLMPDAQRPRTHCFRQADCGSWRGNLLIQSACWRDGSANERCGRLWRRRWCG